MKQALCVLLLASGCYDDRYRCTEHVQCDLGEGGRCEVDDYCTFYDQRCSTWRRYAPHAGELTDQCFDDRVEPLNACAGGQRPAKREEGACYEAVCDRLEACCDVAWFDACVQIAQEVDACNLDCDTRLAITAVRNTTSERWEVTWSNNQWGTPVGRNELSALSWVAPAPGTTDPRLSGATFDELVIGSTRITVDSGRTYHSITSVGFDRDARDTIAASYSTTAGNFVDLYKLDEPTPVPRTFGVPAADILTWSEADRDTYPDAIAWGGAGAFNFLYNVQDDKFDHVLLNRGPGNLAGGNTPGTPQLRSFDSIDFTGDGKLDMLIFGMEVRVHSNELGLGDVAAMQIDCDPPSAQRPCNNQIDDEPDLEAASFSGVGVPTKNGLFAVISMFPGRKVYRLEPSGGLTQMAFDNDTCACTKSCNNMCPNEGCVCTYNCNQCPPVLAFVARDLDRDRQLDIIAIDSKLVLYVALASDGYRWGSGTPIPTSFANTFFTVDVSVSGATP